MTEHCAYCGHSIALDGSMAAHLKRCRLYYPGAPTRAERLGFKAGTASPSVKQNAGVKQKPKPKGRPKKTPEGFDRTAYMRDYMRRKRSQQASKDGANASAANNG